LHDEITIVPKQLSLIIGTRIEHNDYTGVEFLPNGRLLWTPNEKNSIWGAVSRAVRTPSRADSDIDYRHRTFQPNSPDLPVPLPPPLNALPARSETFGNPDLKSETVISYELGYRTAPVANTTMDVALFYNEYDQLRTLELGAPQIEYVGMIPSNVYGPLYLTNKMHGHTYGIELAVGLSPFDWWRLHGTYSYLKSTLYLDAASIYGYQYQFDKKNAQDGSPRHQASVRSGFDITRQLSFDIWLRYADRIESIGGSSIPSYVTMDARLAWKLVKNIELALVGQNLFHDRQQEFIPDLINTTPSGVPRGFYGKMTWKF
jgi:iron complex outermembrane receptor protein